MDAPQINTVQTVRTTPTRRKRMSLWAWAIPPAVLLVIVGLIVVFLNSRLSPLQNKILENIRENVVGVDTLKVIAWENRTVSLCDFGQLVQQVGSGSRIVNDFVKANSYYLDDPCIVVRYERGPAGARTIESVFYVLTDDRSEVEFGPLNAIVLAK
jgi:hypothetical protein